jgi:hypothetical protein
MFEGKTIYTSLGSEAEHRTASKHFFFGLFLEVIL